MLHALHTSPGEALTGVPRGGDPGDLWVVEDGISDQARISGGPCKVSFVTQSAYSALTRGRCAEPKSPKMMFNVGINRLP